MINANELRIGNQLNYSNSFTPTTFDVIEVSVINHIDKIIRDKEDNIYSYDLLYGISLTSEILERYGFERRSSTYDHHWDLADYSFTIAKEDNGFAVFASEWTIGKPFQYLHQLQNLYFALTGEELQINL